MGSALAVSILCSAFLALFVSTTVLAVEFQIPFDDARWKQHDCDPSSDTLLEVLNADNLQITANGDDVWENDDEYAAFYLESINDDFVVKVEIISQGDTNGWAKAGIMVRNDMTKNGQADGKGYCMVAITPDNGYAFQWDSNGDGYLDKNTNTGSAPSSSYPRKLKLEKVGTTFTAYYEIGHVWVEIDSQDLGATANATQHVGLFVCSHTSGDESTVQFKKFKGEIDFTIDPTTYTITAQAGDNGSISTTGPDPTVIPGGTSADVTVIEGGTETFQVSPDEGYEVDTVSVDGNPGTLTGSEYTFTNVTTDHTINVTFVATTNTITPTVGANGSILPSSAVEVTYGDDQTFTVTPGSGYQVDTVLVDGVSASLTGNKYTFTNVTADHTIEVTFTAIVHTITATSGANGSISPSGAINVNDGNDKTFTVTPASEEYQVDTVLVDGTAAGLTAGEYTFSTVTADHTIHVTFTDTGTYTTEIPGCATSTSTNYESGFDAANFDLLNMGVESDKLVLQTGQQAIDPDSIVIPFKQEVAVTFLYECAGYVSDFGWILKDDAVNSDGSFKGWNNIPLGKRHPVFTNIRDDSEGSGGDGVLDSDSGNGGFPTANETSLATYDDGTDYTFAVDGDGQVTPKDMKKVLGTFEAGAEIVFFLTADKDWDTSDTSGVFFTKKDWNPDTYNACGSGTFDKVYDLGQASSGGGCTIDGGWLDNDAVNRMDTIFGVTLSGDYNLPITVGQKYSHVIIGAPADDPNQWILGWEDLMGAGDADHNDMVFRIERKTGGIAELKSSQAITPTDADAYFTAITFQVYDNMPCSGDTWITYYLSIDNGDNWTEITDWDIVNTVTCGSKALGAEVTNWTPGTPQCTYRSVRVDFAGMGLCGRELIWKAELVSEDETCSPEIVDVILDGSVATHGSFSRASPVVQTNVLYSGSYETPALTWDDKVLRGHLKATRIYDPADPSTTAALDIWDAGTVLNGKSPGARNIYFPDITTTAVTNETVAAGDGTTTTFSGTLAHYPVAATTLAITDQTETFQDKHTDVMEGSLNGTGTINRFTGAFQIIFNTAPGNGVPIKASYSYYTTTSTLLAFNATNVSNAMLSLDDTYIQGAGYTYDLDNDGGVDEDDGDWLVNWVRGYKDGSSTKKDWLLGPIDHSVPAVATPPGRPAWYYGTAITETERQGYDTFRDTYATRQTVVYVGARDGMLHAFDGGKFRWGDNPDTGGITENRGYFLWENRTADCPTHCVGICTQCPNYGTGEELWAFIPANLISRLKNNLLVADDQSYVDASPALADLYISGAWKTVLLCAEGNGGDSVFALDVTNPGSPSFMWEFADPDLFRSRSSPAVAQIGRILVDGSAKWVAFFVSGRTYDPTLYPSIYIIDIADGSVIQRIFLDAESGGVGGVPSGQPAIVDSDGNGYIDRVYIGTDKGFMYKVNIPDDPDTVAYGIDHCVINTDFNYDDGTEHTVPTTQRNHPIYASPAVMVDNRLSESGEIEYNIRIFFGTGDSPYYDENINTSETTYYFFAYIDDDDKGECNVGPVYLNWFYELPAGHRIFASAFGAAGNIYFGTSTAETEDPCEGPNEGKIFALSAEGGNPVLESQVGNITSAPLIEDQHLYFKTPTGLQSLGGDSYNTGINMGGIPRTTIQSWKEIF